MDEENWKSLLEMVDSLSEEELETSLDRKDDEPDVFFPCDEFRVESGMAEKNG